VSHNLLAPGRMSAVSCRISDLYRVSAVSFLLSQKHARNGYLEYSTQTPCVLFVIVHLYIYIIIIIISLIEPIRKIVIVYEIIIFKSFSF